MLSWTGEGGVVQHLTAELPEVRDEIFSLVRPVALEETQKVWIADSKRSPSPALYFGVRRRATPSGSILHRSKRIAGHKAGSYDGCGHP